MGCAQMSNDNPGEDNGEFPIITLHGGFDVEGWSGIVGVKVGPHVLQVWRVVRHVQDEAGCGQRLFGTQLEPDTHPHDSEESPLQSDLYHTRRHFNATS